MIHRFNLTLAINKRTGIVNTTRWLSLRKSLRSKEEERQKYRKPLASEVLTCHLTHSKFPPWTSYFIKYEDIVNDQRGRSHFNWTIQQDHNYHILRTGCYPYIKYHCTKRPYENLDIEDKFFRIIKVMNLGLPCLAYGIAAKYLIKHTELVPTPKGNVTIYFLYEEDKGSMY